MVTLFIMIFISIFFSTIYIENPRFFSSAMAQMKKNELPNKDAFGEGKSSIAGSKSTQIKNSPLSKRSNEDPTLYSSKQIEMLQKLVNRREFIEAQFEELALREGILGAAEKRIDKKIQEMRRLELALKKLIANKVKK
tara:strand:+ start:11604 stop:12017 length:414 start_codon:yes stop_codon:yes gene_type:complete